MKHKILKNDEVEYASYNDLQKRSNRIFAKNKDPYKALKEA